MINTSNKLEKNTRELIERLKESLLLSGKTVAEVSRNLNVTHRGVTKWFSEGKIAKHRILPLAEFLSVDPIWLATGKKAEVYNSSNIESDTFLIQCTRLVIGLTQGKPISEEQQNEKIIEIYRDGIETKSINPALITSLLNMV